MSSQALPEFSSVHRYKHGTLFSKRDQERSQNWEQNKYKQDAKLADGAGPPNVSPVSTRYYQVAQLVSLKLSNQNHQSVPQFFKLIILY